MDEQKSVQIERLKNRREFLAVKKGSRWHGRAFVLQSRLRDEIPNASQRPPVVRYGITVTKKIGNAVVRNRVRRRLREAVRLVGPGHSATGCDYVLLARQEVLDIGFQQLVGELTNSLAQVKRKILVKSSQKQPISDQSDRPARSKSIGPELHG